MRPILIGLWVAAWLLGCSDSREELMRELSDPSPVKRAGALKVLAKDGSAEAYRVLNSALGDTSVVVRIAAVRALAGFKDRDPIPMLMRAARDKDPEVREVVVELLAARGGGKAQEVLVDMLAQGEPNRSVRSSVFAALARQGLGGEAFGDALAKAEIDMIAERWDEARPAQRALLVRIAGRSVHPSGLQYVILGMGDLDAEVATEAVSMLQGRGGDAALRRLLLLSADTAESLRRAALSVLHDYGEDGAEIIKAALRDIQPEIRRVALDQLRRIETPLDTVVICPLLVDEDPIVAEKTAVVVRERKIDCDLSFVEFDLAKPDSPDYEAAIRVLETLGTEESQKLLGREFKRSKSAHPRLAAALLRSGDTRKRVRRLLEGELSRMLDDFETWSTSWIAGTLGPAAERQGGSGQEEEPRKDKTRLTEEELKKLYEKHGLGRASENAPRGISDLLAAFPEYNQGDREPALFACIEPLDVEHFASSLDGLLSAPEADADKNQEIVRRAMKLGHTGLVGRTLSVVLARGGNPMANQGPLGNRGGDWFDEELLGHLLGLVQTGTTDKVEAIVRFLGKTKDPAVVAALAAQLDEASFDKRELLIDVIGSSGREEGVEPLTRMLAGYSAATAARALGQLGSKDAIEPLRSALEQAGPSAEMSLLAALARLGDREIVSRLGGKLHDPDPRVRVEAVILLGEVGGAEAAKALQTTRYDPDRFVRQKTQQNLEASGERADD